MTKHAAQLQAGRRVRVAFLTPTLLMGGAERWMISLARCCDRRRIEWTGTALTAWAQARDELCREMSCFMPVYGGPRQAGCSAHVVRCSSGKSALQAALRDADVLVAWGIPSLARICDGYSGPVVFVSHASSEWTAETVRSSESGATHFAAVSEAALRPFSAPVRESATVIHNGIDVERCTATIAPHRTRARWGPFRN